MQEKRKIFGFLRKMEALGGLGKKLGKRGEEPGIGAFPENRKK